MSRYPHCGRCEPWTRLIHLGEDRVARCPDCHPLRTEERPQMCPQHRGQPADSCSCCAADEKGREPEVVDVERCAHQTPRGIACLRCRRAAVSLRFAAPEVRRAHGS